MQTKKQYHDTVTHAQQKQDINDFHDFMHIFNDDFDLAALALKKLTNEDENLYYIKQLLEFRRCIWVLHDEINHILDLPQHFISSFIQEYKPIVEKDQKNGELRKYHQECLEYAKSRGLEYVVPKITRAKPRAKPRGLKQSTLTANIISSYKLKHISRHATAQRRALNIVKEVLYPTVKRIVLTPSELRQRYKLIELAPRHKQTSTKASVGVDRRLREYRTYTHWKTREYLKRIA